MIGKTGHAPVILGLQELEFLFNSVQGFWDSELEGLACSLVRRLGATREEGGPREGMRVDGSNNKSRGRGVGGIQTNKILIKLEDAEK